LESLLARWHGLGSRWRWLAAGVGAVVVAGVLTSALYALGIAAAIAAAAGVGWLLRLSRFRAPAVFAVGAAGLLVLGLAFQGAADPSSQLPDEPGSVTLNLPPRQDQVAALTAADPGSPTTWMVAGFNLSRSEPTDPGVVAFERVLLMDPSNTRAALELASTFLAFGRTELNEEIAAYYTAVAGYPAPDLPRQP
jgi:hypothetical protein